MAKSPENVEQSGTAVEEKEATAVRKLSGLYNDSAMQAALSLQTIAEKESRTDLEENRRLAEQASHKVSEGDLSGLESMLVSQASTLETLFNTMARRGANTQNMSHMEAYMKLALRAQSQCRTTISALAEIKNPKAVFVSGQANISGGHQQVNNGGEQSSRAQGQKPDSAKQTINEDDQ